MMQNLISLKTDLVILNRLCRFRLSFLVTFSAVTGFLLTGFPVNRRLILLISGIFLLSSGASVINQIQEAGRDALMRRTGNRPIPAGEMTKGKASALSVFLLLAGLFSLHRLGWIPVALGLLNIVLYNGIYTPLKVKSWLAILPGALVGAIPPLIGWASSGADLYHPRVIYIAVFVFIWQIPHFWLLMIKYGKEYEKAGFSSITGTLNANQVKRVVYVWIIFTSLYFLLFPLFDFPFNLFVFWGLFVVNLFFVLLFYRLLFMANISRPILKAFVLINLYAVLVFVFLIMTVLLI